MDVNLATTEHIDGFYNSSAHSLSISATIKKIDGIDLQIGQIILFKDQKNKMHNGIYQIKNIGENNTINLVRTRNSLYIKKDSVIFIMDGETQKNNTFIFSSDDKIFTTGISAQNYNKVV